MHRRHPNRPVLVSAAPYAWGSSNSSECPADFDRITTEDACRTAAIAAGKAYIGPPEAIADRPGGCFWNEQNGHSVFLNSDPAGSAYPRRLLLCAGARARARTHTHIRARVGTKAGRQAHMSVCVSACPHERANAHVCRYIYIYMYA
jgi:hypothetical protein